MGSLAMGLFTCISMFAQSSTSLPPVVTRLLKRMTLEEKVGQMTQVTLGVIGTAQDGEIDTAALARAVRQYQVGSILNVTNHALSLEQWHRVILQIQQSARQNRLQIPVLYGLDAIHGQTYTLGSTLFPHNIALAATRNDLLVKAVNEVTAKELRASGVRWNFAPVLDLGRQPLWSRFPETFGEDVCIARNMGVAAVRGNEGTDLRQPSSVAACLKHYIGYSASRTGKDRTPIYLPEIELREYYLPPFAAAIRSGVASIMINSSEINGTPVHASRYLLTDVLRRELKFDGVAVSDWEDIIRLHTRHFVAASPLAAVAMAVNAGVDMSMVPMDFSFYDLLLEAVRKKLVPESRINEAVGRILTMKYKLGLFGLADPEPAAAANFGQPAYQQLALQAALESMTLLKNEQSVLPLNTSARLLLVGPAAHSITCLNGAWSYTWQGKDPAWYPADSKTIQQALQETFPNLLDVPDRGFDDSFAATIQTMKERAAEADAIVLCLGEEAYAESPGNIRDLALPANQQALAQAALATGKPIVLILAEGRPRLITDIAQSSTAILMSYWSGKKTGEAIAAVLSGQYNPAGKLPFSYPRSMGEMVLYDRKPTENVREIFNENVLMNGYDPLFAFGHGLSYTRFEYRELKADRAVLRGNDTIRLQVRVRNTGSREGQEAVELYTRDQYASITPNTRRLRAYQKITLKAGAEQWVEFRLTRSDLAFVNAALQTVTEPGLFDAMIGSESITFTYQP